MKTLMLAYTGATMAGLFLIGCSSTGSSVPLLEPAAPPLVVPLSGENFVVYYTDAMGLRRRDTRVGSDSVVLPRSPVITYGETAFGMELSAFAQRSTDSTWLRIVLDGSDAPATVHRGGMGSYSFAWSDDRRQLAFGFQPGQTDARSAGVWVVSGGGDVQPVGCRAANRVYAWRSNRQLLVGDSRNVYTVDARTCATIATLPRLGKQDFAFASGGGKLSFARGTELHIANYDGSGSQKIADPQVAARDASWAPDGSRVAFVINSPRFANRTHVAVHDVATRRVSYNDRESPMGVPNELNPCWSPDGRYLSFDRVFDRSDGAQAYQTRQIVIRRDTNETVVFEELVRERRQPPGANCTWVDETHILVVTDSGFRVINVEDRTEYAIGDVESVLLVRVHG